MENATVQENNRNPDGTFKAGFSGNPGGAPKKSLKKYVASKLAALSDEEKDKWLIEHNIAGIDQWKMGEGAPRQGVTGEDLEGNVTPILGGQTQKDVPKNNGVSQNPK